MSNRISGTDGDTGDEYPEAMREEGPGMWQVAEEGNLPQTHPDAADFLAQLKADLNDEFPGLHFMAMMQSGMYDSLLSFAFVSGMPGEKVSSAEIEFVARKAAEVLSDAALIIMAVSGAFSLKVRADGRMAVGLRDHARDKVKARSQEIKDRLEGKQGGPSDEV